MTTHTQDPGIYPSDFKAPDNIRDIQRIFRAYKFFDGRMIGGSKSHYCQEHPKDLVVFNANIIISEYGKVFFGDINLSEEYLVLREIAECLDTTLYVLWEMDARFGSESKTFAELKERAVWNTNEETPTIEWYTKQRGF